MRTYGQHCALARTLDAVGDRWTLLIVRELLTRDCRFGELRRGLPGIASNLLADRLRELGAGGLAEPVLGDGVVRYRLTDRGRDLAPALRELARWAVPEMYAGPGEDVQQGHWLVLAAGALLDGTRFRGPKPLLLQFEASGESVWLRLRKGSPVEVGLGVRPQADATIVGTLHQCLAAIVGVVEHDPAQVTGAVERLDELPRIDLSEPGAISRRA